MKIIINPGKPSKQNLKALYDVCNKLFHDEKLFYTTKQVKDLKARKENIFI